MKSGDVVTVRDGQVRALTYLPSSQRCVCWLPEGPWKVVGGTLIAGDCYGASPTPALILIRPSPMIQDGVYFIGTTVSGGG